MHSSRIIARIRVRFPPYDTFPHYFTLFTPPPTILIIRGSLREALDEALFMDAKGMNYQAILETAADIAKGMIHLHAHNVLHSDLKAANVMLKSGGGDGRGVVAKVADFGMSIRLSVSSGVPGSSIS